MTKLYRLYGESKRGTYHSYTGSPNHRSFEQRFNSFAAGLKDRVRRAGCGEVVTESWSGATEVEIKKRIEDIKAGLIPNSVVLVDDKWVDAYKGNWYKNNEAVPSSSSGPKKPVPAVPLEVFQDKERLKNIDYMAAVRDMCKGMR
jgi:hypothetical protein